ncbi:MAG: glpD2, partial [Thermoleophilia bacterium]|nr:glpD2 [Thermoleophilia bacterium]
MPAASTPPAEPIAFTASSRTATLEAMAREPLDVLVVGGGITGVGVALDAASRGLRVGIVEADDWACGTSSRSSKMIHGGLRYLASGDVGVVRESLRERRRLQRNAEHLVRPLSMLLPSYGRFPFQRIKLGIGLWVYEALGHRAAAGALHAWRSVAETSRLVPGISLDAPAGGGRLRGAHHYHDGSADDVRLVLAVLRTALAHGALASNGTPVLRLLRDGDRVRGAVVGGDAASAATGARDGELEIEARIVVNATGVWADRTITEGSDGQLASFRVMPSKGIHLTVRRDRVGIESGIAFFEQTGNANVFVEPWQDDLAFIGTTDAPYSGDLARPEATDEEVAWLLEKVNQFLRTPLTTDDVLSRWAGLRPLVTPAEGADEQSKDVSRRHLLVDRPGILTITGGKLTAYRSMAEVTVDAAMSQLGRKGRSRTRTLALDGSRPLPTPAELDALAARLGIVRA